MEALVSMVVLSIAVMAINRGFAEAVLTRAIARDYTQARFFLEQVAGEVEMTPVLMDGATGEGNFGKDNSRFSYTWAVSKKDVAPPKIPSYLPPQMQRMAAEFEPPIEYLGELSVRVSWTRAGGSYSAELNTIIAPNRIVVLEGEENAPPE
jgi:argininosuccinate synthase